MTEILPAALHLHTLEFRTWEILNAQLLLYREYSQGLM